LIKANTPQKWSSKLSLLCSIVFLMTCLTWSQTNDVTLNRAQGTKLRIVTYNGYYSSIFPGDDGSPPLNRPDRTKNFERVAKAVNADIWAMQEILYSGDERSTKSSEGILAYMKSITSVEWHMGFEGAGRILFSRYPILWQKKIAGRVHANLIDLPESVSDKDILVINVHYHPSNQTQRNDQGRAAANFIKDVIAGTVPEVPSDAMLMLCGDYNSGTNDYPYRAVSSVNPDIGSSGQYNAILT